jgi:hypothetical protein
MGCHPETVTQFADQLRRLINLGATPAQLDEHLDRLVDVLLRATEWDADRWGLDPDRFCIKERRIMETRIVASGGNRHWFSWNRASHL